MDTNHLNVNDTTYTSWGRHGRVDVRKGRVVKKTPSGVVTVQIGNITKTFNQNGRERATGYSGGFLITEGDYDRLIETSNLQKAETHANYVCQRITERRINQTNRAETLTMLKAAIEAVEAIPTKD